MFDFWLVDSPKIWVSIFGESIPRKSKSSFFGQLTSGTNHAGGVDLCNSMYWLSCIRSKSFGFSIFVFLVLNWNDIDLISACWLQIKQCCLRLCNSSQCSNMLRFQVIVCHFVTVSLNIMIGQGSRAPPLYLFDISPLDGHLIRLNLFG